MQKVTFDHFSCWADSVRVAGRVPIVISLFGNHNEVRAVWAKLVGLHARQGRKRRYMSYSGVYVGDDSLALPEDVHYFSLQRPISSQVLHQILIHPDATSQAPGVKDGFYFVGHDPQKRFWQKFNRLCAVPLKDSWRDTVWWLGREKNLITELHGFGVPAFQVLTGAEWAEIIGAAVRDGVLR